MNVPKKCGECCDKDAQVWIQIAPGLVLAFCGEHANSQNYKRYIKKYMRG